MIRFLRRRSTPRLPGRRLAAPSWVVAGSLEENCRFLSGQVDEVGLLFFDTDASMAYTAKDMPTDLADLPLAWHVHLPVDLPWQDPRRCAAICVTLLDKIDFLHPGRAVLHPSPIEAAARLRVFVKALADLGRKPEILALENVRDCDLQALEGVIGEFSLQVCLDLGHVLAYGQEALLECPGLLGRVTLVHLSATVPGKDRHAPLTALDAAGKTLLRRLLGAVPASAVLLPEVFDWPGFEASRNVLVDVLKNLCPAR